MTKFPKNICSGDSIELSNGLYATVTIEPDCDYGNPWEEGDGHGIIEERRTNYTGYVPTKPGEVVIFAERGRGYVYNVKETIEKAKSEGWGLRGDERKGLTKRQIIAKAVNNDMEHMRSWLNGEWQYCVVIVTITDKDGLEIDKCSLGGVPDESGDYLTETANECLSEVMEYTPQALESAIAKLAEHTESLRSIAAGV